MRGPYILAEAGPAAFRNLHGRVCTLVAERERAHQPSRDASHASNLLEGLQLVGGQRLAHGCQQYGLPAYPGIAARAWPSKAGLRELWRRLTLGFTFEPASK
jgi:hypothetical protein